MARNDTKTAPVLSWRAPEFYYYEKGSRWLTSIIVAGLLLLGYFLFLDKLNWTAALLVIAGVYALYRQAFRKPENIKIEIRPDGVVIGQESVAYDDLSSFNVTSHGEYLTLDFQHKRFGMPLSALLGDQDPDQVRTVIGRYLPERTATAESINDRIGRLLRF